MGDYKYDSNDGLSLVDAAEALEHGPAPVLFDSLVYKPGRTQEQPLESADEGNSEDQPELLGLDNQSLEKENFESCDEHQPTFWLPNGLEQRRPDDDSHSHAWQINFLHSRLNFTFTRLQELEKKMVQDGIFDPK